MAIYEITQDCIRSIDETSFGAVDLSERGDLQRLLCKQIEIVSPDTLVIAEEFCEWEDSRRRIDLLGLDRQANLVVIELKRTEDGGHMELQAVRYAAMVSAMTFDKVVDVYAAYLTRTGNQADARKSVLEFLSWEEPDEDHFAQDVRIVLVSAEFSKELTTAVMWLNERELDIRCVRMKPYADNGRVLVDVQQVIPLPEAADFMVRIKEKEVRERSARREKSELDELLPRFWAGLLQRAKGKTELHAHLTPRARLAIGINVRPNISLNYCFGHTAPRVELYIHGSSRENAKETYDKLLTAKAEIEGRFGGPLGWERLDDKRACRIRADLASGTLRDEAKWPTLQDSMIDTMIRFEKALRPNIDGLG